MPRTELLTVGEAFEDLVFVNLPRIPRPGEELKTGDFRRLPGGGAVRTAIAAARLGVRTAIVSALGAEGEARLRAEGVTVRNLRRAGEPPAISVALSTRANRAFVTYNGVNDCLEPRLWEARAGFAARHVHFAFCPPRCRRWAGVVTSLRRRGITSSWDFGWNEPLVRDAGFAALAAALDVLFVNEDEALLYTAKTKMPAALDHWRDHARTTVVKLGREGARLVSASLNIHMPAGRVRAVDTTGAGDAFNGGWLTAFLRGWPPDHALALGNWVAGRAIRSAGGLDTLPFERELP